MPITEIVSENDFFDYEAKYLGKSEEITPARLTATENDKVTAIAKKVYEVLKLKGFSRSEYIFKDGEPHLLEINTVPGLTEESILPQQAAAAGIPQSALEAALSNANGQQQQGQQQASNLELLQRIIQQQQQQQQQQGDNSQYYGHGHGYGNEYQR